MKKDLPIQKLPELNDGAMLGPSRGAHPREAYIGPRLGQSWYSSLGRSND